MTAHENIHTPSVPVDINAEFGRIPQTPPANQFDGQKTWSSPRRRRWAWGYSKNSTSSETYSDQNKQSSGLDQPTRRLSVKNMFSSVRNGLFQSHIPIEDHSKEILPVCQEGVQETIHIHEVVDDSDNKEESQELRRSKSLSFLESIGRTLSLRRNSKQQSGMLRVYPGLDKLERSREAHEKEMSDCQKDDPEYLRSLGCAETTRQFDSGNNESDQVPKPSHAQELTKQLGFEPPQTKYEYARWDTQHFVSDSLNGDCSQHRPLEESSYLTYRGATPDSYLEMLIESLYLPSDAPLIPQNSHERSWHNSPTPENQLGFLLPTLADEAQTNCVVEMGKCAGFLHSLDQNCFQAPYAEYHPEGFEVDQQYQRDPQPSVSVQEVSSLSDTSGTEQQFFELGKEGCTEINYQGDEQAVHETIEMRIKRTVAAMTKNIHPGSDFESGSSTTTKPSSLPKQGVHNNSENIEPEFLSSFGRGQIKHWDAYWQEIVKKGGRVSISPTSSGDSVISWGAQIRFLDELEAVDGSSDESKKGKERVDSESDSVSMPGTYHAIRGTVFQEKNKMKPYAYTPNKFTVVEEPLLNWGSSTFGSRQMNLGPVQVNFPKTATSEGHTKLYDTKCEAMTAIYHKNNGQYDCMCTFDPMIRVIFVHEMGKFVPKDDEIEKLGLEILFMQTEKYGDNYLQPLFSPRFEWEVSSNMGASMSNLDQLTANVLTQQPVSGEDEAWGNFDLRYSVDCDVLEPLEVINIQPPNSPVSSATTHFDATECEKDVPVSEDTFVLGEPSSSRSWLGSQNSSSSSDLDRADAIQPYNKFSNTCHWAPVALQHAWESKTWPALGREYTTKVEMSTPNAWTIEEDGTSEQSKQYWSICSECRYSVNGESEHFTVPINSVYPDHWDAFPDYDFAIELEAAENRRLQQAIDQLVCMKGDAFDRGITLISNPSNHQAEVDKGGAEASGVKEWTGRTANTGQENHGLLHNSKIRRIKDKPNCSENLVSKSEIDHKDMRVFSYTLEYSPQQSSTGTYFQPSTQAQLHRFDGNREDHKDNLRNASGSSDFSNVSESRFTQYLNELAEIASNGSAVDNKASTKDEVSDIGCIGLGRIERCRIPVDANGSPRRITAEDLNIRIIGKAAKESKLAKEQAKGCALVGIFQSHGIMPRSPTPRNPATLGSSPFNSRTHIGSEAPSENSPPIAKDQNHNTGAESARNAKAVAFKRAFSVVSAQSTDGSSGFGNPLEAMPRRENPFWEY